MADSALLTAAIAYAKQGYSVMPLKPLSKVPLLVSWKDYQKKALSEADLRGFWRDVPDANVGIITGRFSNLAVVDLDGPKAVAALKAQNVALPPTRTFKTPHGWHYVYAYTDKLHQGAAFADGVDCRAEGGYIVAPPSVVWPCTKGSCTIPEAEHPRDYKVLRDIPTVDYADVPALFERVKAQTNGAKPDLGPQPEWVALALLNGAPEGQRNDLASRLAGYFRSINLPQDIALAALKQFADACVPPMHFEELRAVVASVWRYQPSKAVTYQGNILPAPIVDATNERRRVFFWPHDGMTVTVDRLRVTGDGIYCWITVSLAEHGDIYGPVRIDLLSDTKRNAFRLAMRERKEHDWLGVIQHVAKLTIESLDPASDLVDMATYEPKQESPWLVEPFLRRRQPSVFFGDGGEGKSTLALATCLSLTTGHPFIPGVIIQQIGNAYYADFESDIDDVIGVAHDLCKGAGVPFPKERLFYRRFSGALIDHADAILRDIAAHQIDAIGIDSLVASGGMDANESEAARMYFNAIRTFGIASLGVSHVSKGDDAKPFGSIFWWNLARNIWHIQKTQDAGESKFLVAMHHKKANRGALRKSVGLSVTFDNGIVYTTTDIQVDPKLAKGTSVIEQICYVIKEHEAQIADIAVDTGFKADTIRRVLNRYRGSRVQKNLATGGWYAMSGTLRDSVPGQSSLSTAGHRTPLTGGESVLSRAEKTNPERDSPTDEDLIYNDDGELIDRNTGRTVKEF